MKKTVALLLLFALSFSLFSCEKENEISAESGNPDETSLSLGEIKCITLSYHGDKKNSFTIKDEKTISEISAYLSNVGGTKRTSTKGYYGVPYTLKISFEDSSSMTFSLWSENSYSTSESVSDNGYPFFYSDDLSGLYGYLQGKFPESFWHPDSGTSAE